MTYATTKSIFAMTTFALTLTGFANAATLDVCASGCSYNSIGDAVDAASAGDTIELAAESFMEGGMVLDKNLTIRTASGMATIDALSFPYVFAITSGTHVDLEDLQLRGGTYCRLDNSGFLDLSTVWVVGSGPGQTSTMGGIFNRASGSMIIADASVVSANASLLYAGGITNNGDLVIMGSTVTGNSGKNGGGLLNRLGTVSVMSSSFSFNSAIHRGGAWANRVLGGNSGSVSFHGSASTSGNTATIDCDEYWDQGGSPSCVD